MQPQQNFVESNNLLPISSSIITRARMQRGNSGLHGVRAGRARRPECPIHQLQALLDLRLIPQPSILIFEQYDVAVGRGPSLAARVVQELQREESLDRRSVLQEHI